MPARIVLPTHEAIEAASLRLLDGGLVAFPTETVYGLGANALDAEAVARIFAAKGRPSTNPIIVHVANVQAARVLTSEWTPLAEKLASAFWPGPLTLVLPKAANVPDIVTAGGLTVGVRVPAHPVALQLLRVSGVPIAAPSANRSEEVSPTLARHVADSLGAFMEDLPVLDGGPCAVGLESTVLDVTGNVPRILRPGMVTTQMLRDVVGEVSEGSAGSDGPERSPGQMVRHYAPSKPVCMSPHDLLHVTQSDGLISVSAHLVKMGNGEKNKSLFRAGKIITMPLEPNEYARLLYAALRELDILETVTRIVVELPPSAPEWAAVHDRLRRATTKKEST